MVEMFRAKPKLFGEDGVVACCAGRAGLGRAELLGHLSCRLRLAGGTYPPSRTVQCGGRGVHLFAVVNHTSRGNCVWRVVERGGGGGGGGEVKSDGGGVKRGD